MNKLSLHASLVAWGQPYVDLLLKVALPALAAPGNLPYLARETSLTFDIYTRGVDAEYIRSHPVFQMLNRIVPIHLNPLIDTLPKRPYPSMTMNDCQRHALAKANREKAPILMLLADIIISNNLGECIHKAFMNGKRAVVAQGMRIRQEAVLRFLEERYGRDPAVLNLSPRELVGLAVKTLHPFIENQFTDSRHFVYSAELYWWVGKSGFLARNFCLSPVAVWPMNPEVLPEITFDDDYIGRAIPSPEAYHIITDSDEGVLFTLAPERYMIDPIPQTERLFSPKAYANQIARFFMTKNLGAIHSHYFLQNVRLHADEIDEMAWKHTEKKAQKVASAILRSFRRQWWSMKFAAPMIRQTTTFFEKLPGLTHRVIFSDFTSKHPSLCFLRQASWDIIWRLISPMGYPHGNAIRRFFLKLYGAKVAAAVQIHSHVEIQTPWKLALHYGSVLAQGVALLGRHAITIGEHAIVDMEVMLRTDGWYGGERDPGVDSWHSAPVTIGREAFIGSRTLIGPGACVADQESVPPFSFRGTNRSLSRDPHSALQNGNGNLRLDRPDSSSFFPNRAAKPLTTPRVDA